MKKIPKIFKIFSLQKDLLVKPLSLTGFAIENELEMHKITLSHSQNQLQALGFRISFT